MWPHEPATPRSKEAARIHQLIDTIMVINTNLAAMVSQRNLAESTTNLQRSLSRLATGSKIVQPQDDAAGLAMAARLDARLKRIEATKSGISNAISFVQTKDGYLGKVQSALERMSELATLAQDGTKSSSDKQLYASEYNSLRAYLIGDGATLDSGTWKVVDSNGNKKLGGLASKEFNGVNLFLTASGTTSSGGATIFTFTNAQAVNLDEQGVDTFKISSTDLVGGATYASNGTTVYSGSLNAITLASTTGWDAAAALQQVTAALDKVTSQRADLGADLSRLNMATDTLSILSENLASATSRIRDVDVAEESASYARYSILVQAGTAMLAQANVIPQTALRLLQ